MALTVREKRFCEEYFKDHNATQAAIRAGYSAKTAYSIAHEILKKPHIREHIGKRLAELALSADETLKAISDIAKSNLNDYFVKRKVVHRPKVVVTLAELIKNTKADIKDIDKLMERLTGLTTDEIQSYEAQKKSLRRQIVEYEIELERNPQATRIIDGEPQLVEISELDMNKLVADNQGGRIKSYSITEFGPKVELCAPDAALVNLAKIHGLFEKDNNQKKDHITPMTDEQVNKFIKALRDNRKTA
jgi:phage terminase small subunit